MHESVPITAGDIDDGHGTQLDAILRLSWLDYVAVVDHGAPRFHDPQVSVHGVLIQANQQIQLISVAEGFLIADSNGQEDMSTSNNGLKRIVRIEVKAAPDEDSGKYVARSCDALPGGASDGEGEIEFTLACLQCDRSGHGSCKTLDVATQHHRHADFTNGPSKPGDYTGKNRHSQFTDDKHQHLTAIGAKHSECWQQAGIGGLDCRNRHVNDDRQDENGLADDDRGLAVQ